MRHIKMINKKKKKIIIISLLITVFVIWLAMFLDVNHRFPQNTEDAIPVGTWRECGGLEIQGVGRTIYLAGEFKEMMERDFPDEAYGVHDDSRGVVATVKVRNPSDESVNLGLYFSEGFVCEAYPSGYSNGFHCMSAKTGLLPAHTDEPMEVKIVYTLIPGTVKSDAIARKLDEDSFRLVHKLYPVKQYIELDSNSK